MNTQPPTASTLVMVAQCVSTDRAANGLNQSIVGPKIGTIVEFDAEARCDSYIIRVTMLLLTDVNPQ